MLEKQPYYGPGDLRTVFLCVDENALTHDITELIRVLAGHCEVCPIEAGQVMELSAEQALLTLRHKEGALEAQFESRARQKALSRPLPTQALPDPVQQKRRKRWSYKQAAYQVMRPFFRTYTPWGSLTGIRPSKLFRQMAAQHGAEGARAMFASQFDVSEEKMNLLTAIAQRQAGILEGVSPEDYDLYIGIPFCRTRCNYCSFAASALEKEGKPIRRMEQLVPAYLDTLHEEIRANVGAFVRMGKRLRSIYIGGGTPTAIQPRQLQALIQTTLKVAGGHGKEFTVEAGRPDSIDKDMLSMLKTMGVTRISINPQSMNNTTLQRIGRAHSAEDIGRAYALARSMGFDHINMDIILGLEGETLQDVEHTLAWMERFGPDSLTVHALALKRASKLREELLGQEEAGRKQRQMAVEEQAAQMQQAAAHAAARMGLTPYYMYRQKYSAGNLENTAYARPGAASLYNVDIMEEEVSILALGAGAISKRVGNGQLERLANPRDIQTYMAAVATKTAERIALWQGQRP